MIPKHHWPLLLAWAGLAGPAPAHVTLEQPKAAAGSPYKAVLRVAHGCEGSPTHTVTVRLPEGFRGARPMPKAGWTIAIRKAALDRPYDSHGRSVTEDVVEVSWQAGSREAWLDDAWYDEFSVRGQLPAQAGPLWFKVQQVCERGRWDWSEVPASGTATQGLKAPAVLLEVMPDAGAGHRH
ncbi:MAG: YcnI family protein [Burkholderiaceae bacterium]|nr:YcnI family protein [Burkholderiaceae bacterium]